MVFLKVCGITGPEDARAAAGSGADAIGLLFTESPRRIGVGRAREISAALPPGVAKVGVFVNASVKEVLSTAREAGLDYAQLHGEETPRTVAEIREGGVRVIKALRVRDESSLVLIRDYAADLYLLDSWSKEARGGTGERFQWGLAERVRGYDNILISGGITPENVGEALEFFEPYGVDASSSLEQAPGEKDDERVRRFVSAARSAAKSRG
ncbi:phosphoribosylanthranilate isomerase [Rubrobacter aplysinae]|uniref:phosphoribosylanthranilate isomerase n=1 Tax=Rubrobacter aplysinae TaxID=909625 RepID=UPI00064BD184|nr:phosphoribosylanthranilate isomerase [Rubrobacter aplysinae]